MTLTLGSLCSGIGLLDLGLERSGLFESRWFCETNDYCRKVLRRHWPAAEIFDDVCKLHDVEAVDVIAAGIPCQPASVAGKRKAQADARWLWPEVVKILAFVEPKIFILENVPGLRSAGLRDVLSDLGRLGFDAEWTTLSAADLGAPHLRRRLFLVATHPERLGVRLRPEWLTGRLQDALRPAWQAFARDFDPASIDPHADGQRRLQQAWRISEERGWARHVGWNLDPLERVPDGGAERLERRRALGNAVVVPCAEAVGSALRTELEFSRAAVA